MTQVLSMPTSPVLSGNMAALPQPEEKKREMRDFGDSLATRKAIFNQALAAAQGVKPMTNARHTLALTNVNYHGPEDYSLAEQKAAILEGRSLGRRLRGTWQLTDNATGGVLDSKTAAIATIPYLTHRGTFINNGNEYTLNNQMRLKAGVFTRIKDNGEIEAHANIMPGEGRAHRYFLDPAKGVFYTRLAQAKIPLLPLLRTMGATDRQLREAWGPELLGANLQNDNPAALTKYYERLLKKDDLTKTDAEKKVALINAMQAMRIDPDVSEKTLGKRYSSMGIEAILDTTKKLLSVARGEAEVDDRDHLAYQTVHGPEDLLAERLSRDYGGVRRGLFNKASWQGTLKSIAPNVLSKQVQSALLHSGLGQSLEEINPADVFDKQSRISRLGEGGIPSLDAVPDEARSVQPSHMGFMDPLRTPESFKVGIDVNIARTARKGSDGKIYSPFKDPRTGEIVYKSPQDVADLAVAFPGEFKRPGKRAWVMQGGRIRKVQRKDVDLVLPHFENAFSPLANMVPFKSATKGQRVSMGSRMFTQALPLVSPEAPWVQSGVPGSEDDSFESLYGNHMGAIRSDRPGRVLAVSPDSIRVRYDDGQEENHELYQNFPYNRKTFIHQMPTVQPGDQITAGQTIAKSNYTNEKGVTALGSNARVAYIPFRGLNFEDAIVISESMAKKMSSEHMYQSRLDKGKEQKLGRASFLGLFPNKFNRKQVETVDEEGVVRVGTEVKQGDPLILGASVAQTGRNRVHKRGSRSFNDASVVWDHQSPGIVTDVVKTDKGISVVTKSVSEMEPGDKLSGRYGDKGVIADIIPDDQMPHGRDGKPFEVLLNPLGIISRTNPSQYIEAALGKIAAKTGKAYRVADFEDIDDLTEFAIQELQKHGLSDTEDVLDPSTGRKIQDADGNVPMVGNRFFMKLHHTAESKGQGRGIGGYTADETPAKGGAEGSKRISMMDVNALLSHGATQVLNDAGNIRGQSNPDYMLSFMQGHNPPAPSIPLTYRKFVNQLRAGGINVVSEATGSHIMALTNKDVDELAGSREVRTGDTVNFDKDLEPVKGGLFDPALTGGHNGNRWSFIKLQEAMPNPVMEEPIRRLLGLTQKKFESVLSGNEDLAVNGASASGPKAIADALKAINLDREIATAREQIKNGKKTYRDEAIRKLGYLKSAKQLGIHPGDWVLNKVPVLPPMFRPISVMSDSKLPLVSDANYLYKELIESNSNLRDMQKEVDDVGDERLGLYNSFKAVTGLADPVHPKLQEKQVRGVLQHIFGSSPKFGTVQRRLLSSTVDLVGRAVITPNPDMDMDHVGIPENKAWDVYKPFIARRLRRRGLNLGEAKQQIEQRSAAAKEELLAAMADRPVFINRAPVLHRFGIMAFWPKLTKNDTVQFSPLIVKGFGADFDGDAVQYHVPIKEEARREAIERMLPSKNLISPADFKTPMHMPGQEYLGGLYDATSKSKKTRPGHRFLTAKDAVQAFLRGDASINTPVVIDT